MWQCILKLWSYSTIRILGGQLGSLTHRITQPWTPTSQQNKSHFCLREIKSITVLSASQGHYQILKFVLIGSMDTNYLLSILYLMLLCPHLPFPEVHSDSQSKMSPSPPFKAISEVTYNMETFLYSLFCVFIAFGYFCTVEWNIDLYILYYLYSRMKHHLLT
jgi:hypothetical protein